MYDAILYSHSTRPPRVRPCAGSRSACEMRWSRASVPQPGPRASSTDLKQTQTDTDGTTSSDLRERERERGSSLVESAGAALHEEGGRG
eukprot:1220998-Rhodomonas_salina.1